MSSAHLTSSFAIGIPTINRADYLNQALDIYRVTFPGVQFYILDNADQQINASENVKVFQSNKNMGVAGSWNFLCNKIFEQYKYALLLNDDIVLRMDRKGIENFIHTQKFDFAASSMNSSVILLPKQTYADVGWFDEQFFPAYYEDNDYFWRLLRKGKIILRTHLLNPAINRESSSIAKDSKLDQSRANRKRYEKKWGGAPGREKYAAPYNTSFL